MTNRDIAELLLQIFGGNQYHAQSAEQNGDIYYSPVEEELTQELLIDHLEGKRVLGSYQLISGSDTVRWLGWDVDSIDVEEARNIVLCLVKHLVDIPHVVEFSGGKGYHVLIFLKEPVHAKKAKIIVDMIREKEGFAKSGKTHVECFPKQDQLTKSRPKGNLLKIPLGRHPRTHAQSVFVDPNNGWEQGPLIDPVTALIDLVSVDDLVAITDNAPDPNVQLVSLIAQHWASGERHNISLFLSGYLAQEGWSIDQVSALIRDVCAATKDDEVYNRIQTAESTFQKHKEGKSIRGRQGLGEIFPLSSMQLLTELVAFIKAPDTVAQIDDIRYTKGRPKLENARLASNTMWSILNDNGSRIFQTDQFVAYWYNIEDHTVTCQDDDEWTAMLNGLFGMNPSDTFSKLVMNELKLRILREAPIVPIQNRTFWDVNSSKLYVNLGGPEVYILNGTEIDKSYNGECGYMFKTNSNGKYVIPNFDPQDPVDAWDHLVNDLSFTSSNDAPAQPEEQRELLKAWLLAFFFQELMPTKPILAMLGVPGSGKTTAIRRVLRIFEDPDADVLGVPTDKQDAFRASIESHRLLVLDNLEKSGAYWMVDILNKLATGNNIELRALYHTNRKHVIEPRCFVACTAVNMPFSDETLFSRLLVLEMQQLDEPIAEHVLQHRIRKYGAAIWGDLLEKLNAVIRAIVKNVNVRAPTKSRLVDFTVFCARIKDSGVVDGIKLEVGLLSMVDAQLRQLKESSQAVVLLEEWISARPDEASEYHTYQELYASLQAMAQARRTDFRWKNALGLSRHLNTLKERLVLDFGAEFEQKFNPSQGKEVVRIRFKTMI